MTQKAKATDRFTKIMPTEYANLDIDATIEYDAYQLIEKGFVPQTKEDKWFIYMNEAGWLHIHRSASGSCIFKVQFESVANGYTITHAKVNRHPDQYKGQDPAYDARLLIYLIRKLLLKHNVPFPMPGNVPHKQKSTHEKMVMGKGDDDGPSFIPLNILN